MPRLSLDTAVARITADAVISRKELADTAGLAAVKADPQGLIDKLAPVAGQMTGRAADAFEGLKAGVAAGNGSAALDALAKESLDAPKLPSWMPATLDMNAAKQGAVDMLVDQGEPATTIGAGKADKLIFTDVDLTMLKTDTPTLLKSKTTGKYFHDPNTGKLKLLFDLGVDLPKLKTQFPQVNFDDFVPDFREFGSVAELLRTNVIPEDIKLLKKSDADAKSRDFVITARSDDIVIDALDLLLSEKGVDINGIFAVNGPTTTAKIGLNAPVDPNAPAGTPPAWKLTSAQRKAVAMAAVILAYGGQDEVKKVKFLDDTDDNLKAAIELLPKMFPKTKFEFVDVEHTGGTRFKQRLMAFTGAGGEVFDARNKNKPFSTDALKAYVDNGVGPLARDPRLYPDG